MHRTNERNEVSLTETATTPTSATAQSTSIRSVYDRPGRLLYDGQFLHRYDAWGRLCEVRSAGLALNADNTINWGSTSPGAVGALAAHYTYDGLGRMVASQKPASRDQTTLAVTSVKISRHLYDGARRIQDVASVPITVAAPLPMEAGRWPEGTTGASSFALECEYVYDPTGDVDAQVAQYGYTYPAGSGTWGAGNDSGTLLYVLQDVNLNVVALADANGLPVAQVGYTPYGQPNLFDIQQSGVVTNLARTNPVGHQGLFYDRFDTGMTPSTGVTSTLDSSDSAFGYYHNRNRTYAPRLGRFVQRDPNITGQSTAAAFHSGDGPSFDLWDPRVVAAYADGMSLHSYQGSMPTGLIDPCGLDWGLAAMIATTAINSYLDATGTMEQAQQHITYLFQVGSMLNTYEVDDEIDADWASDWSQPDWMYSRGATAEAYGVSFDHDDDATAPSGPAMAWTVKVSPRGARGGVRAAEDIERMEEQLERRAARREATVRQRNAQTTRMNSRGDPIEGNKKPSGAGYRDRASANKGSSGVRTNRSGGASRERNIGHPDGEEHSRVPKGTGGGQGRRR